MEIELAGSLATRRVHYCPLDAENKNPTPLCGVGFEHYPIKAVPVPVQIGYSIWPAFRMVWSINSCTLLSSVVVK